MTNKQIKDLSQDMFELTKYDELESERIDSPVYSYWRSVFRKFF